MVSGDKKALAVRHRRSCWSMASAHSTISASDVEAGPVGGGEDIPVGGRDCRGPADLVMTGELDHDRLLVAQLRRRQPAVVTVEPPAGGEGEPEPDGDRKSTRLNSSHV